MNPPSALDAQTHETINGTPRNKPDGTLRMKKRTIQDASLVAVVLITTVALIWVVLPFYGGVLWAVILAILFSPLHDRLEHVLGGRRNLAALLSVLACIFIVVIPATLILGALARQATSVYQSVSSQEPDLAAVMDQVRGAMPSFVLDALSAMNLGSFEEIQSRLVSFVGQAAQFIASRAMVIGQGAAQFSIGLGVMLYVLFFLFRDGRGLVGSISAASPLSAPHTRHIMQKFVDVVKATVTGNVVIATIQGTIGGVTFWLVGIEAALLCGVIMGVLSLLPAVGAFLVWLPFAVYYLITGAYLKGIVIMAVGVLVISTIDNLLRPPLVGRRSSLPDYVVLVSTLGGISQMGMNGFVVGPLIAAFFIAVWSLFRDEQ
jgi:predicted PurR-regulated permease PerM